MSSLTLLHACLFTPMPVGWGLPALFEGEPGIAKTAVITSVTHSVGLALVMLSPGLHGEGAFGVVPVPMKCVGGMRLTYPAPDWVDDLEDGGVVFVDEVTTAPMQLQAPMLGLVAGHQVGNTKLNSRVRVIGACNPPELAANGQELSPPLANRFVWLPWKVPTVEEHAAYMLGALSGSGAVSDAELEEARVTDLWPTAYARAAGLEVAFHKATGGSWKNRCPKADATNLSRAWPSDRTWEYATRALASSYVHSLNEQERHMLIEGCIGKDACAAFETFIEEQDLPDVEALLDGTVTYTFDPRRIDRIATVLSAAQATVCAKAAKRRKERADALWGLLQAVPKSARDLSVGVAQALCDEGLHDTPKAGKVLADLNKLLRVTR